MERERERERRASYIWEAIKDRAGWVYQAELQEEYLLTRKSVESAVRCARNALVGKPDQVPSHYILSSNLGYKVGGTDEELIAFYKARFETAQTLLRAIRPLEEYFKESGIDLEELQKRAHQEAISNEGICFDPID